MKLHKLLYTILPALALASCNDFENEDERYTPIEEAGVEIEKLLTHNVLMIEFTGQNCVNCPTAHEEIEKYEHIFGERFISVSIHGYAAQMGLPPMLPYALGTEDGVKYNEMFGIEAWPNAVIDWNSGKLGSNYGKWLGILFEDLCKPATTLIIQPTALFKDGKIEVTTVLNNESNSDSDVKYMVWLSESDIVSMQITPSGQMNPTYVHNNVFRASLCGLTGEDVTVESGKTVTLTHSIDKGSKWVAENMAAVVFAYTDTEGVISVEKVPVTVE